jgi:hypothetical protein
MVPLATFYVPGTGTYMKVMTFLKFRPELPYGSGSAFDWILDSNLHTNADPDPKGVKSAEIEGGKGPKDKKSLPVPVLKIKPFV